MKNIYTIGIIDLDAFEICYYSIFDVFSYDFDKAKFFDYKNALKKYKEIKKYLSNVEKYKKELESLEIGLTDLLNNNTIEIAIYNESKDKAIKTKIIDLKK